MAALIFQLWAEFSGLVSSLNSPKSCPKPNPLKP